MTHFTTPYIILHYTIYINYIYNVMLYVYFFGYLDFPLVSKLHEGRDFLLFAAVYLVPLAWLPHRDRRDI